MHRPRPSRHFNHLTRLAHLRRSHFAAQDSPGSCNHERGDTLIEILVSITIIGIVVAALFNGLIETTMGSVTHRSLVNLDNLAQSYLETAEYDIQQAGHFQTCSSADNYTNELTSLGWAVPSFYANYTVSVTRVEYWTTASGWVSTCPAGTTGIQQIDVTALAPDHSSVQLAGVVRDPKYASTYQTCYNQGAC